MEGKPYRSNKRTYYLNLRSNDALITQIGAGNVPNNYKFEWNIKGINVSRQARMCLTALYFQDAIIENPALPIVIRCNQAQNTNSYDSANGPSTIIYIGNMLHLPVIENWHPINGQHLDRIELLLSNSVNDINNGITNSIQFYIQLKIEDFDTEEVDPKLMPKYTSDSLSYRAPFNVK